MSKKLNVFVIAVFLCLFFMVPAQAAEENDGVAMVAFITAKEGHEKNLLEAIEDYHKWVAQFDGHKQFDWYEILTGPDTGKYIARTCCHDWADFDAEFDWQKEAGEAFEKNVAPHVDHVMVQMTSHMGEVSHWPESFDGYNMFQVEDWYIKNGRYGAFNKGLKRIVNALKAGGFPHHFGFHSVDSGGYAGQVTLVLPNKGWAGMADAEPSFGEIMIKELGGEAEFNAFMADWGDTFKSGKTRMVKHLPDASDYGND